MDEDNEWWRALGSLPAKIGPADLKTLNIGLRSLFEELAEAQEVFATGNSVAGSRLALSAATAFIGLFRANAEKGLAVPLHRLLDALDALDNGKIDPLLKPVEPAKKAGHPPAPEMRASFIGAVAFTVHLLCELGYPLAKAHSEVADALKRAGVRPGRGSGPMTGRTVRGWCDKVNEDVGRHGEAAQRYYQLKSDPRSAAFNRIPPEQAAKNVLINLRRMATMLGQKAS